MSNSKNKRKKNLNKKFIVKKIKIKNYILAIVTLNKLENFIKSSFLRGNGISFLVSLLVFLLALQYGSNHFIMTCFFKKKFKC